jgi:hypothetical protein
MRLKALPVVDGGHIKEQYAVEFDKADLATPSAEFVAFVRELDVPWLTTGNLTEFSLQVQVKYAGED